MKENAHLKEILDGKDAELEMHRQSDNENRLGGMMRVARVSRMHSVPHPMTFA